MGLGDLFKSRAQKEAEAVTRAHRVRQTNGQRVRGKQKALTPKQQIKDQEREWKARGWM